MEEEKEHFTGDPAKKDSEHESEIQSLVEDKTQISIDNNPDKKFKPAEFKKTVKKNPWIMATIVLGIIALVLLVLMLRGGITGNIITGRVIGEADAGERLMAFAEAQGINLEILDMTVDGNFYDVLISINGQESNVKLTKDGENMVQLIPLMTPDLEQTQLSVDVPKSDKPKVELFVMTHCPYGTQAEKGILPVYNLLDDKIDGNIKFVHYFMHEPEETETPIQVCIREEQEDKYLDYLACFLEGDGNADASGYVKNNKDSENCRKEVGIDESKLSSCIENEAEGYYVSDSDLCQGYGVGGSPTLVINGVIADSGRSPAAYLETICLAFNDAPEECNEELNTANPSAGFGYTASAGGSTNAQC